MLAVAIAAPKISFEMFAMICSPRRSVLGCPSEMNAYYGALFPYCRAGAKRSS
jgi:hypothetical protein